MPFLLLWAEITFYIVVGQFVALPVSQGHSHILLHPKIFEVENIGQQIQEEYVRLLHILNALKAQKPLPFERL